MCVCVQIRFVTALIVYSTLLLATRLRQTVSAAIHLNPWQTHTRCSTSYYYLRVYLLKRTLSILSAPWTWANYFASPTELDRWESPHTMDLNSIDLLSFKASYNNESTTVYKVQVNTNPIVSHLAYGAAGARRSRTPPPQPPPPRVHSLPTRALNPQLWYVLLPSPVTVGNGFTVFFCLANRLCARVRAAVEAVGRQGPRPLLEATRNAHKATSGRECGRE